MKRPRKKRLTNQQRDDELVALLESLPRTVVSHDGPYTYQDRARDFLAVFGDDKGKRVMSQIAQFCDPPPLLLDADKPGTLALKSGVRMVFAHIMSCMVAREPIKVETSPQEKE